MLALENTRLLAKLLLELQVACSIKLARMAFLVLRRFPRYTTKNIPSLGQVAETQVATRRNPDDNIPLIRQ